MARFSLISRHSFAALTTGGLMLALVVSTSLPAAAQVRGQSGAAEADRTVERLDRIENQLRDLQAAVFSVEDQPAELPLRQGTGGANGAASMDPADVSVRILGIEQSLAELTGKVEEISYRLDRQQRLLDRLENQGGPEYGAPSTLPGVDGARTPDTAGNGPVDLMGGGEPTGPADGAGAASEPEAPAVELPDSPDLAFDEAYQSVLAADYEQAEAKLEAFIAKFPESAQTAEAKYLLGEIYLATGANSEAAKVLLDHVSTYPDDPRSPEAYLKLGIAFKRLNRPEEACRVFNAGVKKFPDMESRLSAKYAAERLEANCN